jgi:glucoamylase
MFCRRVALLATLSSAYASPVRHDIRATGSLSTWLASESTIANNGVLANLGPDGSKTSCVYPGLFVASPSTSEPDCMIPLSFCR